MHVGIVMGSVEIMERKGHDLRRRETIITVKVGKEFVGLFAVRNEGFFCSNGKDG